MTYQEWTQTISGSVALAEIYRSMATSNPTMFELNRGSRQAYELYKAKFGQLRKKEK